MESVTETILYCGDQTDDWTAGIDHAYSQAATMPWLAGFLDEILRAFKQELDGVDRRFAASIVDASSLLELAEAYRYEADDVGLVHSLLLHAVRAVELLQWANKARNQLDTPTQRPHLLGISGGVINLSTFAIATSFETLYQAVIYVARVFTRLCRLTLLRSRAIEDCGCGAWGWAVVGILPDELQKSIDQFQQDMGISPMKRVKVAVSGDRWCTIIGPPSVLDSVLKQCTAVKDLPQNPLNIHALLHCVQLTASEVDYMVGSSTLLDTAIVPGFRLWGMHNPNAAYANWGDFLRTMVAETVSLPLDITKVMTQLNPALGSRALEFRAFGPSSHVPYLLGSLKAAGSSLTLHGDEGLQRSSDATSTRDSIAIIGMAGRGPGSENIEDFWSNILAKRDLHEEIRKDRFDVQGYYGTEPGSPCKMSSRYGCFMDSPGSFDSRFFHVSPREALYMDPGHRQFLMTSYEALEIAGYSDSRTRNVDPKRIGTFYGQSNDDWFMVTHNALGCDPYTLQGVQRSFAPGRIAHHFKWEGPTYAIDSACASASSALHLARLSLINGDVDMAVAGAANILSYPHSFVLLSKSGVLSDTGNCKTYQDNADGYCRGDFVGTVVLKRLEDAIAHNDNVLAVVTSSGRNHSGNATSMTTSDADAQKSLFRKVMRGARVLPDDIDYVEMHGTGTQVGDRAELNAVSSISKRRRAGNSLPVGSVKANIGHSEAAAGIPSLWKCIKMFQTRTIPPQAVLPHMINTSFPALFDINIDIPTAPRAFGDVDKKLRILLNNFDAAGGNVSMMLEEPQNVTAKDPDPRKGHVIATSAKTIASYRANKTNLLRFLETHPDTKIEDIAYSTTARKIHHPLRFVCAATTVEELIAKLRSDEHDNAGRTPARGASVIFVFSGQGFCYSGMGKELYATSQVFRSQVDLCARLCEEFEFPRFIDIITDDTLDLSRMSTAATQLATAALEVGLAAFWRSIGVVPSMTLGHSLGEYVALHIAGVLSLADMLWLIGQRAGLIQEQCERSAYSMLAVSTSDRTVRAALAKQLQSSCDVACKNAPNATVISGTADDIANFRSTFADVRSKILSIPYGFHSTQMDSILDDYMAIASGVTYQAPEIPVVSTLLGSIVKEPGTFGARYMVQQTRHAVDFVEAIRIARATCGEGEPLWLELGPSPVCGSFIRATLGESSPLSCLEENVNAWVSISKCLARIYAAGNSIDWTAFHAPYTNSVRLVTLPTYAWDLKDYWLTYEESEYEKVAQCTTETGERPISSCATHVVSKALSPEPTMTLGVSTEDSVFGTLLDGHRMRDVSICPATVFCEAGLAAAERVLRYAGIKRPEAARLALRQISIKRPLTSGLIRGEGQLNTTATVRSTGGTTLLISWKVLSENASYDLGSCTVVYSDTLSLQADWDRHSYFIRSKIDYLIQDVKDGRGHRMLADIFYALMNATVRYSEYFKGVGEAFISADFREAVAEVILKDHPPGATFVASPYWGETLVHLAGFLVNADPRRPDPTSTTLIMDSFDGFDQTVDLLPGRLYHSYARVISGNDDTIQCEICVFDADQLVMRCNGLRFHRVRNDVLDRLLGIASPNAAPIPTRMEGRRVPELSTNSKAREAQTADHCQSKYPQHGTFDLSNEADETPPSSPAANNGAFDQLLEIIAKETGCSVSDFEDDMLLTELGVDSIMGIEIAAKASSSAGISDLRPSFLVEYPAIRDLRQAFGDGPNMHTGSKATPDQNTPVTSASESSGNPDDFVKVEKPSEGEVLHEDELLYVKELPGKEILPGEEEPLKIAPTAPASVESASPKTRISLLQGKRSSGHRALYLIADGTGSIATYIHMPALKSKMPIYGIESPYRNCPSRLSIATGGIPEAARIIVDALTKFQPEGPLSIGGFSGGAMLAYEVCLQLIAAGRTVDRLLLIDMCCPRPLGTDDDNDLAGRIYDSLASTQTGPWKPSPSAQQHLKAMFACVAAYHPKPIDLAQRPRRVALVWAQKGLIDRCSGDEGVLRLLAQRGIPTTPYPGYMEDGRLGSITWSLAHKTDEYLGPNGWERFVGEVKMWSVDADHLDMFMPSHVHLLHAVMEEAMIHLNS